jgi:hypothetical protein
MVFLQSILFFIIVKVLVYYFKSPKDKPVNRNIEHDVFESQIENSGSDYEEEFESSFFIDEKVDLAVKNLRPKIKYISNGRQLLCDLQRYYYLKLGLPLPIMRIDRDVIVRAYETKLATELEDNSDVDIVAAGHFFEDRIAYLNLN